MHRMTQFLGHKTHPISNNGSKIMVASVKWPIDNPTHFNE